MQTFVVFDGRDPTVFATTPDNPVRLDSDGEGGFTRISSSTTGAGVKVLIGPGLASRLAGQRIRVTVSRPFVDGARRGQHALRLSERPCHQPLADREPVAAIRRRRPDLARADVRTTARRRLSVVEPGIPGDGTGVDIRSIRIDCSLRRREPLAVAAPGPRHSRPR